MSGASLTMSGGPAGASDLVLTNSRISAVAGAIILIGADITTNATAIDTVDKAYQLTKTQVGDNLTKIGVIEQNIAANSSNIIAISTLVSANTAAIITTNESLDATAIAVGLKADKLTTYTKTESDALITNLVNSAPATLDTLKEIADALGNDADLAGNLTTAIGTKATKTDMTASLLLKADNLTTYSKEQTDLKYQP